MKKNAFFLMFFTAVYALSSQNVDSLLNVLNTQKLTAEKQLSIYEQ